MFTSKNIAIISGIALVVGVGTFATTKSIYSEKFEKDDASGEYGMMQGRESQNMGMGSMGKMADKPNKGNCLSEDCLAVANLEYPAGELSSEVAAALASALDDEYKAYATYDAVINQFGNVRPFIMIIRAEEQHISSLKALFDKYGLEIPENSYVGNITAPASLAEACATGVNAEIANADLYKDQLLPAAKDYSDITAVFASLMNASQEKHLPAFERCSN